MLDGQPEPNISPTALMPAIGRALDDCEVVARAWRALDRSYAVLLETLGELEAVCDPQPSPANA
jgi:hypothetical protein